MGWLVLILVYLAIGVGISIFFIRVDTIDPDLKPFGKAGIFLIGEGLLFWPVILFMEIKRRRTSNQDAKNHFD